MAPLRPFEQIDAGGVDSRSNPINMPRNRALRCLNWVPRQAGFWELRWGYSTVTMSTVSASLISGLFPYRTWNGNKYVLFVQGTTLKTLDTSSGTVTTPAVRGAAISSSAKGQGTFVNNKFFYGNGTDQKWFDGTTWRDSGLNSLTNQQAAAVGISEGAREFTAAQASTVSLTAGSGGSWPAMTQTGILVYMAIFDTSNNEIGPATINVGTRIKIGSGQKLTIDNYPNWDVTNTNWLMLIGFTQDGGGIAFPSAEIGTAITSCTRSGTTLTVASTTHGHSTGDVVGLGGTTNFDGIYKATVVDANTFTVTLPALNTGANTTGGNVYTMKTIPNGSTAAIDVTDANQFPYYQLNQVIGIAASTVGGTNAGYQFYASIYNPTAGAHVGNRIAVGSRFLQTGYRCNVHVTGLPDLSGTDSEWAILIGRTGDGALVPYPCVDSGSNWLYAVPGETSVSVLDSGIDGQHEMPTRNGVIPSQCNMFCLAGDYLYAADTGSPYLRRSGSLADGLAGLFTGDPAQSWAGDDLETFPTSEALTGIFEVDQEVFCGTLHDTAISANLAGVQQWIGPWQVGLAGRRAATKCGAHGFVWLSADKELCMLANGVPVGISEEYEAAELAQIGTSYISTVELVYYRDKTKGIDQLRIEAQKQDGTPYTIIHDFKLIEVDSPPGSIYGQGYSSTFVGALGTAFTSSAVRDSDGLAVYAGASNGQIYKLYSGANDAGTEYDADLILLVNGGTNRPSVPFIDWYGDSEVDVSLGSTLSTSLASGSQFAFQELTPSDNPAQAVQGSENDFLYRAYLQPPEIQHAYIRFQLTSHSADGNLSLNSPPHIPLENYGRIYELIPSVGDERER